jgi:hypothetical protein
MATVACSLVRRDGNAEVVDHVFLAQQLVGLRVAVFPLPVLGAVDLSGRLGVATQADLGQLGSAVELRCNSLNLEWSAVVVNLTSRASWDQDDAMAISPNQQPNQTIRTTRRDVVLMYDLSCFKSEYSKWWM